MRIRNTSYGVCQPRSGRHQSNSEFPGKLRVRLCHVNRSAFVTYVDDTDAMRVEPHPDRHDMSAAERKDTFHATPLQKPRNEIGSAVLRDFHL